MLQWCGQKLKKKSSCPVSLKGEPAGCIISLQQPTVLRGMKEVKGLGICCHGKPVMLASGRRPFACVTPMGGVRMQKAVDLHTIWDVDSASCSVKREARAPAFVGRTDCQFSRNLFCGCPSWDAEHTVSVLLFAALLPSPASRE